MKYRFSEKALLSMSTDVGFEKETAFTNHLYRKLNKAWWYSNMNLFGIIFPPLKKVELSPEELDFLWQVCNKGDGTLLGRGREAGIELAKILNKAIPHHTPSLIA